jgi:hypothetical protein
MVVRHVTVDPDFDLVILTITLEGTAGEARRTFLDTGVYRRVNCHSTHFEFSNVFGIRIGATTLRQ